MCSYYARCQRPWVSAANTTEGLHLYGSAFKDKVQVQRERTNPREGGGGAEDSKRKGNKRYVSEAVFGREHSRRACLTVSRAQPTGLTWSTESRSRQGLPPGSDSQIPTGSDRSAPLSPKSRGGGRGHSLELSRSPAWHHDGPPQSSPGGPAEARAAGRLLSEGGPQQASTRRNSNSPMGKARPPTRHPGSQLRRKYHLRVASGPCGGHSGLGAGKPCPQHTHLTM